MKRIASLCLALLLALSLAAPVSAADKTTGTKMSLEEFDGTVTVRDAAGKDKTARADMRLYNGYTIATGKASSAYINLDDTAAVKLDRGTKVEIRTLGKQLDVHLLSGQLFFDTKVPRKADQSYTISTSTTVTGVRGSFGWVNLKQMGMVHGHSTVTYVDEETGKTVTIPITSGEGLSCNEDGGAAVSGNAGTFEKTVLTVADIPAIVAEAIAADPQKQAQVDEVANLDTQEIVDSVDEKKKAEAQAEEKAEKTAEDAAGQQQEEIKQLDAEDKAAGEETKVKLDADKKAEEEAKAREEAREERIREREEITEPPAQPSEPSQPSTPSGNFTVQWGNNTPGELFWDAVDGADGYRITMRSETGEEKISGFHDDPWGNMCYDLAELGEGSYTISVSAFKGNELLGNSDNTLTAIVSVTSAATYSADYDESHKILTYEFTASAGTAQDGHWYRLLAECGNNHCSWSMGNVYSDNTVNANLTQRELSQPLEDGDYIDVRIFTNLSTNGSTQSFTVSDAAHTQKSDLRRAERVKVTASDSQGGKLLVNSLESFYVLKSNASFTLTSNSAFAFNQNTTHVTMNGDALTVNVVDYSTLTVSGFSVNSSDDVNLQVSNDGGTGSSSQYGISFPTDSSNLHLTFTASSWPADDSLYVKLARADGDSFGNKVSQTSNSIPIPPKAGSYTEADVYYYRSGHFSADDLITAIQLPGTLTIAEGTTASPFSGDVSGTVSSENDIPILTISNLTPGYVYYYQPAETDDLDPVTLNGTGTADTVSGTVHTNQGSGTLYALKGEPASGSSSGYLVTVYKYNLVPN